MSHNNNSANSGGGNYTVSCEYFGTYTNNLPECISFENPQGNSDGNTYYYYLGSSNLSNVTSDSFTMGTYKGNAVQIGGDPVDSNRDWGNQWNNGQYNNSTFTFVNNSMFVTTSGDKPNSAFVKKPISNYPNPTNLNIPSDNDVYGGDSRSYMVNLACKDQIYFYGTAIYSLYEGQIFSAYAFYSGYGIQDIRRMDNFYRNYRYSTDSLGVKLAVTILKDFPNECVPVGVFYQQNNQSSAVGDAAIPSGVAWTNDGSATDIPDFVKKGHKEKTCLYKQTMLGYPYLLQVSCSGDYNDTNTVDSSNVQKMVDDCTKSSLPDWKICSNRSDDMSILYRYNSSYAASFATGINKNYPMISFTPSDGYCNPAQYFIDNGLTNSDDGISWPTISKRINNGNCSQGGILFYMKKK